MIFFGHLGLTHAVTAVSEKAGLGNRLTRQDRPFDCRLVFIGSILPDLVDKPLITLLANGTVHSGRVFAHTLVFVLLLAVVGLLVQKKYNSLWALTLAWGSLIHLILDEMWNYPETLFWPAYDLFISKGRNYAHPITHALASLFNQKFESVSAHSLLDTLKEPSKGIPEILGLLILAWFFLRLVRSRKLPGFLKSGSLH